jgi:hypothetical protein
MARAAAKTLGASPKQITRELRQFSHAARLLSKDRPRLIHKYPKKWVGIFGEKIQAVDGTFKGLIRKLKQQNIDPSKTLIRFIDTSDRKMIL